MLLTPDALNAALDALAHGASGNPFAILGPHVVHTGGTSRVVILTIQPSAARVEVVRLGPGDQRTLVEMRRLPQGIIFAAQFVGEAQILRLPPARHGDGRADVARAGRPLPLRAGDGRA